MCIGGHESVLLLCVRASNHRKVASHSCACVCIHTCVHVSRNAMHFLSCVCVCARAFVMFINFFLAIIVICLNTFFFMYVSLNHEP